MPFVPAGGEGARAGAAYRLVGVGRPGPRLYGRRSLHRPQRSAPARRPADLRAFGPGHRIAAGPQFAGGAGVEAGVHLAGLQPHPPFVAGRAVQRRAVRVQGHSAGRRTAAAADGRGHRMVLRHRDAGPRRAGRAAHPRGAGRLGRRPRLHGPHRADGHRGPERRVAGGAGAGRRRAAAGPSRPALRGRSARPRAERCAGRPGPAAGRVLCRGRALHALLSRPVLALPAGSRPADRQRRCAAGLGRRQYGSQPEAHLRRTRPERRGTPSGAGPRRLRRRPRADQRLARGAGRGVRVSLARDGTRRADRGQPRGDGAALPALPRLGLPGPGPAAGRADDTHHELGNVR